MFNIKDVAEVILSYGPISHKKLQKLCYYVYAWYYVIFLEKVCDTHFEAWVHGPVSPELYSDYKMHGWNLITQSSSADKLGITKIRFIESIVNIYGSYDAEQLENMTHEEDPWINARKGLSKYVGSDRHISELEILQYYSEHEKEIYETLVNIFR